MRYIRNEKFQDVILIQPQVYHDDRGHFFESFQVNRYQEIGIPHTFVQDNYSNSIKNTIRGLHYQLQHPQGKLVGVTSGIVFDVIVDIRRHSHTFGEWISIELDAKNFTQIYIPPGFAHGFCVMSDTASFYYKCTDYYRAGDDFGVAWNDKQLNIPWPLSDSPILSDKDKKYFSLAQIPMTSLPAYHHESL
ncbi:MAG TPA: dTDP-4-dehydrorhamnose 3,5-epimerase [Gammaproteobacteria bacterium]|jgi:dTDP-4-dehydrorhamnose 3,5-epimerase|nr:dTDP-4-dehydrorhamnose 3,5-epimerase [Gammaproteobacteria bacterium]